MDDDQWSNWTSGPSPIPREFKIHDSEWVLNSSSAAYILNDPDTDAHTPLLIEVHANLYSGSRAKALNRNPEERQKLRKAAGSSTDPAAETSSPQGEAASGTSNTGSKGSQRPPKPAHPPKGKHGGKTAEKGGKSSKGKDKRRGKGKY